jgi:hypothetical protein
VGFFFVRVKAHLLELKDSYEFRRTAFFACDV